MDVVFQSHLPEAYIHAMPDSPKYRKIRKFYHYVGRSVQIRLSREPYLFKAIIVWPYADYLMVKTMVDGESYLMEVKYGEINGVMYQTRDGDYEWYRFRGEHDGDKKERIKVGRKDHDEWDW